MADRTVGVNLGLTEAEKQELLDIARKTIEARAKGDPAPEVAAPLDPGLQEKRGAFVSLHRGGQLRGCIGYIQAVKPLYQAVQDMALSAAFQDPRFDPLTPPELEDLEIEISVLTPFEKISGSQDIEIGVHGLMVKQGPFSGLLLPQVAVQFDWDAVTFISQTCIKAGLPPNAWQDQKTEIFAFSADVF